MSRQKERAEFEKNKVIYDSAKLTFLGVEGYDVYNCSTIVHDNGKNYIFGRVEKRDRWADSTVMLFEETGKDTYRLVPDSRTYPLEDPYITRIHGEYILGGTHVRKSRGEVDMYYANFYRGYDLKNLVYFTSGPERMKDIRLIELENGKVGIFSRPRGKDILEKYGSESMIGYEEIDSVDELDAAVIAGAEYLPDIFRENEWGGCNQVYRLADGCLGIIGHLSERVKKGNILCSVYMNMAFCLDRRTMRCGEMAIIGTRTCYPEGPCKKDFLMDCAFTSGISLREDGRVDLYSGIGDCEEGRITIDDPFRIHGGVLSI